MGNRSESLFFYADLAALNLGASLTLNTEESHHAIKVFRHRADDILELGDGQGCVGYGKITLASEKSCALELIEKKAVTPEPRVHLAIAALKDNDLEEVMESCAQLNLASLTILRTAHSLEPRDSDMGRTVRRLEMKSLTGLKQARKTWLTRVYGPTPIAQWAKQCEQRIVLCDLGGKADLRDQFNLQESICIVVGPEGGFSDAEHALLSTPNALRLTLGSTRLRAKTCPIVALGALIANGIME